MEGGKRDQNVVWGAWIYCMIFRKLPSQQHIFLTEVKNKQTGRKWEMKRSREEERKPLQSSHVVECQVQLLAESLALQLLSIHLIWKRTRTPGQDMTDRDTKKRRGQKREKIQAVKKWPTRNLPIKANQPTWKESIETSYWFWMYVTFIKLAVFLDYRYIQENGQFYTWRILKMFTVHSLFDAVLGCMSSYGVSDAGGWTLTPDCWVTVTFTTQPTGRHIQHNLWGLLYNLHTGLGIPLCILGRGGHVGSAVNITKPRFTKETQ